ncbi:hypothetical protein M0P48_01705 [Candidatus Gracilibacteria bacterium]|nr:hypothetical protein [Candidatus Gracilibacteria bacterium]
MKKNIIFTVLLVLMFTFSACSQQENTNEPTKDQSQVNKEAPSVITYKSNLYGFQFNYPAQYSSQDIKLNNIGMENISNGNEVFGVQFFVPYASSNPTSGMQFFFDILTPNEKAAELALGEGITQEEIKQILNNTTSQKVYSSEDVRGYADTSYQESKKNENFKISDKIEEISIAGEKAYQYRMTSTTVSGNPSELYIFISDRNTVYKIVLTDSPLMQEVLSSLKFKD